MAQQPVVIGSVINDHQGDSLRSAFYKLNANDTELYARAGGGFTFTQPTASNTWNVSHTLGKHPSVTVVDSSGREVEGDVSYVDTATLIITFSAPFAGVAYLN